MIRKTSPIFLALALVASAFGREEYTRTIDNTLPLRGGERVSIENKLGDISIRTHSQLQATIHAEIHVCASNTNRAKEIADRIGVEAQTSSSELSIRTRYPDSFHGFENISYFVHYEITIPETAPLEVRNSFGAVSVTGLLANADIVASHGALEFRNGRGTQQLKNSFANIKVANNVGDVTVDCTNGSADVNGVTGALNLRSRFGAITVTRAAKGVSITGSNGSVQVTDSGGVGTIRNSFGSVTVDNFHGDLTVNNTNGKIEAHNVSGAAELNTTFGAVQFSDVGRQLSIRASNSTVEGEGVGGPLTVQNSFGPVTVSGVQGGAQITSGNGSVTLARIRGQANVRTSFAMVNANDIAGALSVRNSNGGVRVEKARGAEVTTSFGGVFLDDIAGPIQVEDQNGSVDATSISDGACQPITIRTSFSTLRLRLAGAPSYRVSARTSFGKVHTDFPLTVMGSLSNDELSGVLGGGRCEMQLTNNNGTIEILKP